MRGRRSLIAAALLGSLLAAPNAARADGGIKVGWYSQQVRPSHAAVGAGIRASAARAGAAHDQGATLAPTQQVAVVVRTHGGAASNLPPSFRPLSTSAPILQDRHPFGPGSFWYRDGAGHACQYVANGVGPCFTLVGPGSNNGAGHISPSAVAQSLARRVGLASGAITTSPTRAGLTGAQSWFWLDPAPRRQSLSISLAGETVTVIAQPTVEWHFGDGSSLDAGPGVSYQADTAPTDAITHVYGSRCLPGDQGHDPYVLASCGHRGYSVEALVVWRITYSAAGPIAASGTLPARTTGTSTAYPVSESRAFLVGGGGQ